MRKVSDDEDETNENNENQELQEKMVDTNQNDSTRGDINKSCSTKDISRSNDEKLSNLKVPGNSNENKKILANLSSEVNKDENPIEKSCEEHENSS